MTRDWYDEGEIGLGNNSFKLVGGDENKLIRFGQMSLATTPSHSFSIRFHGGVKVIIMESIFNSSVARQKAVRSEVRTSKFQGYCNSKVYNLDLDEIHG